MKLIFEVLGPLLILFPIDTAVLGGYHNADVKTNPFGGKLPVDVLPLHLLLLMVDQLFA